MESLWRDARYAIRSLAVNRLLALVIVISLGLAIGVTTTVYSFAEAVVLRPLPYHEPERLVLLWGSKSHEVKRGISGLDLTDLRAENQVLVDAVPFLGPESLAIGSDSEDIGTVRAYYVGSGLFSLLGVQPYLGRSFLPEEEQSGARKVVVLSFSLWKSRFGGDVGLVGRKIHLDGDSYIVTGVMPPQFFFPDQSVQAWSPILPSMLPSSRGSPVVHGVGRLKPGVSLGQAQTDMDRIVRGIALVHPDTGRNLQIGLYSLQDEILGNYREAFWSLLGGMGLLLLIACANVAHLLLARGMRRRAELSVRVVFGATRGSILRQLLVESLLLGACAGGVGVMFALWGVHVLRGLGLSDLPRFSDATVDETTLLFALTLSVLSSLFFGLLPALRASRPDLVESLKQGGTAHPYTARGHLRELLLVSQVAFAFVLMAGAGLLINSFIRLARLNWGFRPDHVLVVDVLLPRESWWNPSHNATFGDQVTRALRDLPPVLSVSVARGSPIGGVVGGPQTVTQDGKQMFYPRLEVVGPDYFETLGIPLLRGRGFTEKDGALSPKVAVVDRALAAQLWPGQDPIGKTVYIVALKRNITKQVGKLLMSGRRTEAWKLADEPNSSEKLPYTVVGEVGRVLMYGPMAIDKSAIYVDYRQRPDGIPMLRQSFLLRTSSEPSGLAKVARDVIRAANGGGDILEPETLHGRVNAATGGRGSNKLLLFVSSVASGLGLLLAGLGVYGVLAFETAVRTREFGVRMALGAQRSQIFRTVLGRGILATGAGVLLGLAGALAATKILASHLFEVTPTDPITFVAAIVLFFVVASLACYLPARRATRVDPMAALRYE